MLTTLGGAAALKLACTSGSAAAATTAATAFQDLGPLPPLDTGHLPHGTPEPPLVLPSDIAGDAPTPDEHGILVAFWNEHLGLDDVYRVIDESRKALAEVPEALVPQGLLSAVQASPAVAAAAAAPVAPAQLASIPGAAAWLSEAWAAASSFAEQHLVCHRGRRSLESSN